MAHLHFFDQKVQFGSVLPKTMEVLLKVLLMIMLVFLIICRGGMKHFMQNDHQGENIGSSYIHRKSMRVMGQSEEVDKKHDLRFIHGFIISMKPFK